jgi:thiol-disulfide isomerase/thioredoxin
MEGNDAMRFEVYGKQNCAKCDSTKDKLAHLLGKMGLPAEIVFVDMGTVTGRAEGAFYDVYDVPTTIVRSARGEEVARFSDIPPSEAVQDLLAAPPA